MPHEEEIWGRDKEACLDTAAPPSGGGLTVKPQRSFESGSFLFFFGCYYIHVCFPSVCLFFYSSPSCWLFKTPGERCILSWWWTVKLGPFLWFFFFPLTCSLRCSPLASWARPPRPISGCQSCDWCASSRPCRPSPSSAPEHPELPDLRHFKMRFYKIRSDKIFFIYPTNMCTVK